MRIHPATSFVSASLLLALVLAPPAIAPAAERADKTFELQSNMRRLWSDHVTWMRLYIVSAAADLPDQDLAAQRLLRNQDEIGAVLKPYYGNPAGDGLTALLRRHVLGAAALVAAVKAKDDAKVEGARTSWFANADSIADFLSAANPRQWPNTEMKSMMHEHLELTYNETTHRLHGEYAADIADFDQIQAQALKMADMLSAGILKQFARKFE
jgi:hypothetical protein